MQVIKTGKAKEEAVCRNALTRAKALFERQGIPYDKETLKLMKDFCHGLDTGDLTIEQVRQILRERREEGCGEEL